MVLAAVVGVFATPASADDTTAPQPVIAAPIENSFTGDTTPTVMGTAGTDPGEKVTVSIQIQGPTNRTFSATVAPDGSFSADSAQLNSGVYTVTATQQDDAGNRGTSTTINFKVSGSGLVFVPVVDEPPAWTTDTTPRISGRGSFVANEATVNLYSGSSATGPPLESHTANASINNNGAYACNDSPSSGCDFAQLPEGTYTVQVTQTDSQGYVGYSSPRPFTVDQTAPSPLLVTGPGGATSDPTPKIVGIAGTADGDTDTVSVRVWSGSDTSGSPLQTKTANVAGDHSWSVDADALPDGTYTVQATQDDLAGNSTTSAPGTFRVDTTAPTVVITSPVDGSSINDSTPHVIGTGGTATGDFPGVTLRIYKGTGTAGQLLSTQSGAVDAQGHFDVVASPVVAGTTTYAVTQLDSALNAGTTTITIRTDYTGPGFTFATPTAGATTGATPTFSGTAGTALGDKPAMKVEIWQGSDDSGPLVQTKTTTAGAGGSYSVDADALTSGTYTAQVSQSDDAGNTSVSVPLRTFTVDADAPTLTLASPINGTATKNRQPNMSGFAGTAAGDSNTVTLDIYSGSSAVGTPIQSIPLNRSGSSFSTQPTALADGTYTARASQNDAVGNVGRSNAATFRVDNVGPSPTVTSPTPNQVVKDSTPTISGTGGTNPGDDATVKLKVYFTDPSPVQNLDVPVSSTNGAWSVDLPQLADGAYSYVVSQQDSVANFGNSVQGIFYVDTSVAPPPPPDDPDDPDESACVVPSIKKGTKLGAVRTALATAGCAVGKTSKKASGSVKKGGLIKLKPKAGTELEAGAAVAVVISSGPKKKRH